MVVFSPPLWSTVNACLLQSFCMAFLFAVKSIIVLQPCPTAKSLHWWMHIDPSVTMETLSRTELTPEPRIEYGWNQQTGHCTFLKMQRSLAHIWNHRLCCIKRFTISHNCVMFYFHKIGHGWHAFSFDTLYTVRERDRFSKALLFQTITEDVSFAFSSFYLGVHFLTAGSKRSRLLASILHFF